MDTTLSFDASLGADYSGVWVTPDTFVITVLDPTGAGEGPRVNKTSGAVLSVASWLHNAPGTSPRSYAEYRIAVGDFGRSESSPRLLRFFARDHDNANASYDAGDQLVMQFDMNVNRGRCLYETTTFDNLPTCARRASGGTDYVDSLLSVSASIGANYSGAWEDGSTFVVTVVDPLPDEEHAPRPFDTVLRIPVEAGITNVAETAPPLFLGPTLLGVAERVETLPMPPRLIDAYASDFSNKHLMPAKGDTIAIKFDMPIDRAGGLYDELAGTVSCVDELAQSCNLQYSQAFRLFDFYNKYNQRITTPFFLEYTTGWLDDQTFLITVINGSSALQPGILAEEWEEAATALADPGTRVALKPGITIQSLSCPEEYAGTPYCTVPTGLEDEAWEYTAPYLHGNFGRVTGPRIVGFSADDPDNGDGHFGNGDQLTITFDQRTNRGRTHDNFGRPYATVFSEGVESQVAYPLGVDDVSGAALVDKLFSFSRPLGTDYSGDWLDDSTFVVTVIDSTGAVAEDNDNGIDNNSNSTDHSGITPNIDSGRDTMTTSGKATRLTTIST